MYLYAIVREPPRRALGRGVRGGALETASAGGAHVVYEASDDEPETAPTPRALRGHDGVVRRIAARSLASLPFRYGSRVRDLAELRRALRPVRAAVSRALAHVDGCVQYTLRVYGQAHAATASEQPGGPGTRWLAERLAARRVPEIAPVSTATKPFVREAKSARHDRGPLVASVYHLVPRADARRYRAALERAARTLDGVRVECSGPWPPYAFAELT